MWRHTALSFYDTVNAKQGDLGSQVLPRNPTGVVWTAGDTVETKWSVRANHGGGCESSSVWPPPPLLPPLLPLPLLLIWMCMQTNTGSVHSPSH